MTAVFVIGIVSAVMWAIASAEASGINFAWEAAARALGARLRAAGALTSPEITDGNVLSIRASRGRNAQTRFDVVAGPHTLFIGRNRDWGFLGSDRCLTGDAPFDELVRVAGDPEDVMALMDEATRSALVGFVQEGGELRDGRLRFRVRGLVRNPDTLARIGKQMIELGALLSRQSRKKLLLATAVADPLAPVRLRALSVLRDHFAKSAEARQAVEACLDDADASVRVVAASMDRGDDARRVLRGVVADARVEAEPRLAAFNWLVSLFGYPRDLVPALLEAPDWTLQRAAVVAVRNARDRSHVERLCALTREEPPELAQAAATTLSALAAAEGEPHLIALLGHREEKVQIAAAQALGVVGGIGAVEPLLPLTRGLLRGDLHAAARDAVRRIQSRLGDVEAGRLSVAAASPEGALSEASSGGGELSVAPGPSRTRTG